MRNWKGILTLLFLAASLAVSAQRASKKGDRYFDVNLFEEAIKYYEVDAKNGDRDAKAYARRMIAECYRIIGEFEKAEDAYARILKKKSNREQAENFLNYGKSLKSSAKFAEAKVQFQEYIKLNPDDPMGPVFLESCDSAQWWLDLTQGKSAYNLTALNSPETDMAPVIVGDQLYFSSSRKGSKKALISFNGGFNIDRLDMYSLNLDLLNGDSIGKLRKMKGINTPTHDGPATFSADGNEVYFTRTVQGVKNKSTNEVVKTLQVWYSRRDSTGMWTEPVSAFDFNSFRYSVGQPSLSKDGKRIFFMSDMRDGWGETDIYFSERDEDGNWGEPQNLGSDVNTFGHELFPYIAEDGTLYFSSDSHPGMGKLDIFKCTIQNGEGVRVTNLQPPFNSIGNDFGIVMDGRYNRGFFTSDRFNGVGAEDIYSFSEGVPLRISLQGDKVRVRDNRVYDQLSYSLRNMSTGEELPLTAKNGFFTLELAPSVEYMLITKKRVFPDNQVSLELATKKDGNVAELKVEAKMKPIELEGYQMDLAQRDSLNPKGKPVSGRTMVLLQGDEQIESAETKSNGFFEFEKTLRPRKKFVLKPEDE